MQNSEPATIDPRRHDGLMFDLEAEVSGPEFAVLARQLRKAKVRAGTVSTRRDGSTALAEAAERLTVRPSRCVVIADDAAVVTLARDGGFALVIGVALGTEQREALGEAGADTVIEDLSGVTVRTGYHRMFALPDASRALDDIAGQPPAVFYDFDGTLSDIVNDPASAKPAQGATSALQKLIARCPVAILSGRDLADVTERVGVSGIWYAGSHGFELTAPDGTHHQNDDAAAAIPVLEQAAAGLRDQLAPIPGVVVELKRFGVAVHYRNAARDRIGDVSAAVRTAGRRDSLRVTTGREVIELRPDIDWDKGKTLRWVLDRMQHHPQGASSGELRPIYLGDDITDEDAFDAVREDGVPIIVRHNDDGDRATAALYALDSPKAVSDFTKGLARHLAEPPGDQ